MGTYRWTYNQCVSFQMRNPSFKGSALRVELRRNFVNRKNLIEKDLSWVLQTPSEIRDRAVLEFLTNLSTQKKLVKEKKKMKFKMHYKKKASRFQCLPMPHREWGKSGGAFAFLAKIKFNAKLPRIEHDYKILFDKWHNSFAIAVPISYRAPQKVSEQTIIALDPGIRNP